MAEMTPRVTLEDRGRSGLFPEHAGIGPVKYEAMATIPAAERLRDAGAVVTPLGGGRHGYEITMGGVMPAGIVAAHADGPAGAPGLALRLDIEPQYPNEHPDYWSQVAFTPCPTCGAPVVWYEAGYVSGYRVCTRPPHHHSLAR